MTMRALRATIALLGALFAAQPWMSARVAAQSSGVGLVSALVGEGTITHSADAGPEPLRLDEEVFLKDRIATGERSVARVLFGGRITVTIRERSIVTITDDPVHPRVELEGGKLAFKVHPNGLRPGEVAEIHTPNTIVGIRGSLVVAEVTGTAANPDSAITVLEANHPITVAPRSSPAQFRSLVPGQRLTISGPPHNARMTPPRWIPRQHLLREAETAEVPGRPRDGGEERRYRVHDSSDARAGQERAERASGAGQVRGTAHGPSSRSHNFGTATHR
jgi:hypothetical protein